MGAARVSLLDVNVLVALFFPDHIHHDLAHDWFADHRHEGWATCPLTENGLIRVACQQPSDDGLVRPADVIARLDNAVRHRAERIFRDARRAGRREPSDAYAFDAATHLLTGAGGGTPVPAGADAKVIVRVDLDALLRGRALDGETCEIAGLGPVPVAVVREWMDNAFLAAIVTRGTEITKVVHLGRRFTSEQRTALQWRDPVCARKGCANRLSLEYDHVEDWAHTHTTRVDAGRRFCSPCHQLKTLGWHVSAPDPDGQCTFTPPPTQDPPTPPATTTREDIAEAARAALRARRGALART